jgi:hypothetical protein
VFVGQAIQWGDPVGDGDTSPRYCWVSAVAKRNSPKHPHLVANELISSRLGTLLGLPTVPGIALPTENNDLAYLSLRIGSTHERPPAVIPEELCAEQPCLATGTIVFDIWIANVDRNDENVCYQKDLVDVLLFDHEKALLSTIGPQRLNVAARFSGGCLQGWIGTDEFFSEWVMRIESIADWQIRNIVREAEGLRAVDRMTAEQLIEFLCQRRSGVRKIIKDGLDAGVFRSIKNRSLLFL